MSSITHSTGTFKTSDNLSLHTARWIPDSPRAAIILVHGYGEHSGRYQHVARALVDRGYAVFALDHRAHGKSEGTPRALVRSIATVVADLKKYVEAVSAEFPHLPRFMLGHSMGGLITWGYIVRHSGDLSAAVISGAPVNADANVSPLLLGFANLANKISPALALVDLTPLVELSHNPQNQEQFAADPLNYHGKLPVGTGVAINEEARFVRSQLPEVTLPALIIYGEDDKIVNPSGSHTAYELIASADKTEKGYPAMKHEILNEIENAVVINDIINWLDAHVA
ncbi:MAG: alpha/beta hydrolase [Anaerolineae bacterium]|nr:alpha/beta hydrolase [Anaerolineae bacterium]